MRTLTILFSSVLLVMSAHAQDAPFPSTPILLAIHGGAGVIPADLTPERETAARAALTAALTSGHAVLKKGGTSLDAVTAAIRVLEDSPEFNAGKGSVLTADGRVELDASIMEGATRRAGAVAGLRQVKNPIDLARMVMEGTPHVLLVGEGAEAFAREKGLAMMPPGYFITEYRMEQLKRAKEKAKNAKPEGSAQVQSEGEPERIGTVGAVALDRQGNLAAGTSTGGMVNKQFGRVGDSPIIGAGTYADNGTCAVSGTGHGEFFIRSVLAYDIAALMQYRGLSLAAAADEVVGHKLKALGGTGGVIAIDKAGNLAMPFNTEAMYRGYIRSDGEPHIAVRRE